MCANKPTTRYSLTRVVIGFAPGKRRLIVRS